MFVFGFFKHTLFYFNNFIRTQLWIQTKFVELANLSGLSTLLKNSKYFVLSKLKIAYESLRVIWFNVYLLSLILLRSFDPSNQEKIKNILATKFTNVSTSGSEKKLTRSRSMFPLYTSWKLQKTSSFQIFTGVSNRNNAIKWVKNI